MADNYEIFICRLLQNSASFAELKCGSLRALILLWYTSDTLLSSAQEKTLDLNERALAPALPSLRLQPPPMLCSATHLAAWPRSGGRVGARSRMKWGKCRDAEA